MLSVFNDRSRLLACLVLAISVLGTSASLAEDEGNKEAAEKSPMGYFLGVSIGQQMAAQGFKPGDFEVSSLSAGFIDGLKKIEPALTDEQLADVKKDIEKLLTQRQEEMMAQRRKLDAEVSASNQTKGDEFLAKNAKEKGVKTLEGGLQYKVLKAGKGGSPSASDTVKVHYTGKLIDGKVFDSSVQRGTPAEFRVDQVIQGWQQALQKMKVGDKWMLYIPASLGYGKRGSPPTIGPNAVLIFEVELLKII